MDASFLSSERIRHILGNNEDDRIDQEATELISKLSEALVQDLADLASGYSNTNNVDDNHVNEAVRMSEEYYFLKEDNG